MKTPFKNIKRYREIIQILLKYGFDEILDRYGLDKYLKGGFKIFSKTKVKDVEHLTIQERVRKALEDLGPTFVKFGQMLSIRPEILPAKFIKELQKLQDQVAPFPTDAAISIIEEDLEQDIDTIFKEFEEEPHAAASLAQVHRAQLHNGEQVIVKVQRPNIRSKIESDLDLLYNMAKIISRNISSELMYQPSELIDEFKHWIKKELNFNQEARNIERFKNHFKDNQDIRIHSVYWDYSSSRIITMEYIDGIRISDIEKIEEAGLDRKKIARIGAEITLTQIFDYGFFHGDPHPGNILVLEGNLIAPMDFGLVGSLDKQL
ncbi:MAG: hypothetical protein K9M80_08185, partial [Candidatus Marinimicrobia bacterium]|nr:hypothetical protein [Candidatus Neomarinimicrobiota bacterium]